MTTKFETLPIELQERIKNTLTAYDEVTVDYEDGQYSLGGACIKSHYSSDHKVIGTYYAKDVFTKDERIVNYANEFQDYSSEYKGKIDYSIFHTGKRETFVLVDGNIQIAK